MIYAFTGKTGSGKTYMMIEAIYPKWLNGVNVYSNTKLDFEKFGGKQDSNIVDNPENFSFIEKVSYFVKGIIYKILKKELKVKKRGKIIYFEDITEILEARDGVICMDEGQNLLEARNWEALPMEFANKLRQHRKHRLDLFTTTQNLGTIDINYRRLVQKWYHVTDMFALLGFRNPSIFTFHKIEEKDIDYLYNSVDDLQVPVLKTKYFTIHPLKKRKYDTMFDIGFTIYTSVWLQKNSDKILLIIPKSMNLSSARQLLSSSKYFFDLSK